MKVDIRNYKHSRFWGELLALLEVVGANWVINKLEIYLEKNRVNVRIDSYDLHNLDQTLSEVIVPALKKLRKANYGIPMVDLNDVPPELRPDNTTIIDYEVDTCFDEHYEARWYWVLDEMIFAFESHLNTADGLFNEEYAKTLDRIDHGMYLFGKYYSSLWN